MIEITPEQMFGIVGIILVIAFIVAIGYAIWNFF